jgi:hypothetical protein
MLQTGRSWVRIPIISLTALGKVNLSLYGPWRPLRLREVEASTFSDIRLTDGACSYRTRQLNLNTVSQGT